MGSTSATGSLSPTSLKLILLPKDIELGARICTLAHPRTCNPSRYYFCPERGVFEFIKVAAPKSVCQSWLIGPRHRPSHNGDSAKLVRPLEDLETTKEPSLPADSTGSVAEGYVIKSPELFVATPIDPLFIVLPSFCGQFSSNKGSSIDSRFISTDDLIERLQVKSKHLDLLSSNKRVRDAFDVRIMAVSDTVVAGDEIMYRINLDKLLTELISKAKNIVSSGFPATLEEKFIHRALEAPMMALKREESSLSDTPKLSQEDKYITGHLSSDQELSQKQDTVTIDTMKTTFTATLNLPIPETHNSSDQVSNVKSLLRLRTALSYMITSYVPPPIEAALNEKLASSSSPIDFKPLDVQLAHIANLRAEAFASRSLADFSRKRSMQEDDEAAEARAEKKQRKEDEEKRRKAGESKGVRDLRKVDVSGMKKMNDFFAKGPSKKK